MVIVRVPLRISLAGGGTDIPAWYKDHGSMFISAAINKYIYITYHRSLIENKIRIRYSKMEEVDDVNEIQNEIVKETLKFCGIKDNIELTSHAEIPSGTGLGSSGSFGVGILNVLNPDLSKWELAKRATEIQLNRLKMPIGLQDQYIAACGGINLFEVDKNGNIEVHNNFLPFNLEDLEEKLVLFYTGFKRDTNEVLRTSNLNGLYMIQELAWATKKALEENRLDDYGYILNEHWQWKKKRNKEMSNPQIDYFYDLALKNGAIGGKLVGAGGGGFLLFYCDDKEKLINSMPLKHLPFKFDYEGSKVLVND